MSLAAQLESLAQEAQRALEQASSLAALEELQHRLLGKKGELSELQKSLRDLPAEERPAAGQAAHRARQLVEETLHLRRESLKAAELRSRLAAERYDALRPLSAPIGRLHPITRMQMEVEDIFSSMGFEIVDGPEVETDENNFGKLNFSADHPARDMQDTIWTSDGNLLRTHTSPIQVRAMQVMQPPFRMIAPGRVYRYEEIDASHENTFHQVEGMLVDREVSAANLIFIMKTFLSQVFERDVTVRLRPGYFPFVEPAFELDIQCLICGGKGCRTCKQSGWIELLPCGLVHPNVLRSGGIDPAKWSGFAFGLGLDRLVMMRYGIEDIRHFLSGNLRFLEQF
ncbi:MAG: phenylalanine--tRNA ligase subunit alpha [Leptospirales bacterium]|nr:phenylalanine--tRNA ligase subunit alpha [Leptospirales bacterium]